MSSPPPPPYSPYAGLPASPRPINTSLPPYSTTSPTTTPTPSSAISTKNGLLIDNRNHAPSDLIFANATIPLSPTTSSSSSSITSNEKFLDTPLKKRTALARLFCCFGAQERARRRRNRYVMEYERPEDLHWSEY
ncbi:hypothetical protein EJ04DRAFT_510893 [Polyplosphaeria fusca]|uniref:Uncharacterized protein n=1 Tax=Polyplosphaeria fusca TaxID=682080 RepID=A0A9P4R5E7_9PLEO|nr:hypothetical protein EJ04DRAFT_510893 [Polyplosphaeria fusca]